MELNDSLLVGTNSCKFKDDWKSFRVDMVKNGCGESDDGILELSLSDEWTDGTNWFFACWYRFTQIDQNWSKSFRWARSKMDFASLVAEL